MVNLIRMDLKRLQKSKSTYVITGVILFMLLLNFVAVYVALNPDIQAWMDANGIMFKVTGIEELKSLSLLNFFHIAFTQNFYLLIIGISVILFHCHEVESGFIKNVLSVHVNKAYYIFSKIIVRSIYTFLLLCASFIEFAILNSVVGTFFIMDSVSELLIYFALLWFIGIAVISMFTALSVWLKSKTGGIAIAIVYATGLWIMIVTTILSILGCSDLLNYTLLFQVNGLFAFMSQYDIYSVFKLLLLVGSFIVIYTALGIYGLKRKDI